MLKYIDSTRRFVKIQDNVVTDVITIEESDCNDVDGNYNEAIGISICEKISSGTWLECASPNNPGCRGNRASVGFTYHTNVATLGVASTDVFMPSKPYDSWVGIHTETATWVPPLTCPDEETTELSDGAHSLYTWDETAYQADNTKGWIVSDSVS
jgi:hypothetical protein|tara:strand:+ start:279 stop:743 length:465 start_codon:yes stop_codon:yes gene_type:complete